MPDNITRHITIMTLLACLAVIPARVSAGDYSRLVVFGDSLSDPGNAFALRGEQTVPPYDTLSPFLVPSAPYAKGGHHLSNGATWIEQLGKTLKLNKSVGPAWRVPGVFTNYAVGGARARDDGINVNLAVQVSAFTGLPNSASLLDGALVVLWLGGNDVRDAVQSADPAAVITAAIVAIQDNITALYLAGATDFLIGNAPDVGLTPAILLADGLFPGLAAGATAASMSFNAALEALLAGLEFALPGISFKRLDAFQFIRDTVADPQGAGLMNVDAACVTPGIPPFSCKKPDNYLFWDGIHPTRAGHAVLAGEAGMVLAN
ncbi:MAG: SGNH/GDSL hydrolase family protein [Halobacteria archaeon]|nr:SGNH/GDSL hydrolase family protein [Halobacteria archaeon]